MVPCGRRISWGVGMLNGGAIDVFSGRQHLASPDTHSTEVLAAGTIMHRLVPVRGVLQEARIPQLRRNWAHQFTSTQHQPYSLRLIVPRLRSRHGFAAVQKFWLNPLSWERPIRSRLMTSTTSRTHTPNVLHSSVGFGTCITRTISWAMLLLVRTSSVTRLPRQSEHSMSTALNRFKGYCCLEVGG